MNKTEVPAVIQRAAKEQKLQISPDNVNLILPTKTYGEIVGQFDKICLEMVTVSLNKQDGDVYDISGKKAFTKTTLMKFADGLAIQWDPKQTYTEIIGPGQIKGKATGAMRKPNGEWIVRSATKVIDLDVVHDELQLKYEKEALKGHPVGYKKYVPWKSSEEEERWIELKVKEGVLQKKKFAHELADTGAKDRVIREFLALKSSYTDQELSKPFVFPRIVVDTQKMLEFKDTRQAALNRMVGAGTSIFGVHHEEDRPETGITQLPEPKQEEEEEDADVIEAIVDDSEDDPFSDQIEEEKKSTRIDELKLKLEEWLNVDTLSASSRAKISEAIDNDSVTEEELESMLDRINEYFAKKEGA